jgi:hypothetical protein
MRAACAETSCFSASMSYRSGAGDVSEVPTPQA